MNIYNMKNVIGEVNVCQEIISFSKTSIVAEYFFSNVASQQLIQILRRWFGTQ